MCGGDSGPVVDWLDSGSAFATAAKAAGDVASIDHKRLADRYSSPDFWLTDVYDHVITSLAS